MSSFPLYCDHAAHTTPYQEVVQRVAEVMAMPGNASSRHHHHGRALADILDHSRSTVAHRFAADESLVTFTSGSTEALNLVMQSVMSRAWPDRPQLLVAATEHPAVMAPAQALAERGVDLRTIPVTSEGVLDHNWLEQSLSSECALICVMLVNNETGVIQDIQAISKIARRHGALVLCDASQAPSRMPIDEVTLDRLGCDFLVISGHKCGGPLGVGALLRRRGLGLDSLIHGGGQERGLRSGTENLPAIAGLATALQLHSDQALQIMTRQQQQLETTLTTALPVTVQGATTRRASGITCLTLNTALNTEDQPSE